MDWDRITRSGARAPGAELNPTPRWCAKRSSARHRAGLPSQTTRRTKGRGKPSIRRRMPGAGLSDGCNGKALSDMPAFQPYWGKPAVRNDRGDGGNVGIIRSPLRATVLPDGGGRSAMVVPTATTEIRMPANFRVARQPPPIPQFSKRDSIWSISATNDALS